MEFRFANGDTDGWSIRLSAAPGVMISSTTSGEDVLEVCWAASGM